MNTPGYNQGRSDAEQNKRAPNLDRASSAERENYWRGPQAGEKK